MSKYNPRGKKVFQVAPTIDLSIPYGQKMGEGYDTLGVWIGIIAYVIVSFLIATRFSPFFVIGLLVFIALIVIGVYLLRYVVFKEQEKRDSYEYLLANDFEIDIEKYWGIYYVDDKNLVYFKNGKVGYYLKCYKDMRVGKGKNVLEGHYLGLEEALNRLFQEGAKVELIDITEKVELNIDYTPVRDAYKGLTQFPIMQQTMDRVVGHLSNITRKSDMDTDILLVKFNARDLHRVQKVMHIVKGILLAKTNYSLVEELNVKEIQKLTISVFNLENFSVQQAMQQLAFKETNFLRVVKKFDLQGNEIESYRKFSWEAIQENKEKELKNKKVVTKSKKGNIKGKNTVDIFDTEDMEDISLDSPKVDVTVVTNYEIGDE